MQQRIPKSVNLLITSNIVDAGGVPGSIHLLIFSLDVVIDHTITQLSLYCLCNSRSLFMIVDFVNT